MYTKLKEYISERLKDFDTIPEERKRTLQDVAGFISKDLDGKGVVKLNFICTHNSRRSHLAQIWTQTAASHFGIDGVETYSGGTEAPAFNPRAVAAIERAGFGVTNPGGDNPGGEVRISDNANPMICVSNKFDDSVNPNKEFAAIMTCSDADENGPHVPGAAWRKSVTYRDPKESEGTDYEKETYDERCRQIATEMFSMMR